MTSVPARMPAATARAGRRPRLSAVIDATASSDTSPVALSRVLSTPDAERLGQRQRQPGAAASLRDEPVEVDQRR